MRRSADGRGTPRNRSPSQNSTAAPPGGTGADAVHASRPPPTDHPGCDCDGDGDPGGDPGGCPTRAVAVLGAARAATTNTGNKSPIERMRDPLPNRPTADQF
ncbi:hypothetical protein CKY47_23255 [Saccharothrix yanglingensis]|uniref:Uncharacterized protein n=1 Tax=Saccharothrix yanglingensis TaxID=659496 RepID=A0ABU0X421_9PSEU|nr:hypothetical protein [Saccharothrix yanglingensis]